MSLWKLSSEPSGHVKEDESGRGCSGAKDGCEEGVYQSTRTVPTINHQLCYFLSGDHLGEARQKVKGVYGQVWLHCTMLSTVFSSGEANRHPPVNKQNQSLGFSGGISIFYCILEANIVFFYPTASVWSFYSPRRLKAASKLKWHIFKNLKNAENQT